MSTVKKAMAVQFTPVSAEDFKLFFHRSFSALKPVTGTYRGEVYYDLEMSEHVSLRVFTSVTTAGYGAGHGEDAIRVSLCARRDGRPLMKGKWPIVKRTQNWRDNLRSLIGEHIEAYESKEEYWDARASSSPSQGLE